MKKWFFVLVILFFTESIIFSGTIFEEKKEISDPFIAEKGGVNSLFVNPAGTVGQSGYDFSFGADVGTTIGMVQMIPLLEKYINRFAGNAEGSVAAIDIEKMAKDNGFSNAEEVLQYAKELLDTGQVDKDALIESVFGTQSDAVNILKDVDLNDVNEVKDAVKKMEVNDPNLQQTMQDNTDAIANGTNAKFKEAMPEPIRATASATIKMGFLVQGFGVGIYEHLKAVAMADVGNVTFGMENIYSEYGVVGGGSLNFLDGDLALGATFNYSFLMQNANLLKISDIRDTLNAPLNYGYGWGFDVGAIYYLTPSLGIGAVFNDLIGSLEYDMPRLASEGFNGLLAGQYDGNTYNYKFSWDLDAGIFFRETGRYGDLRLGFDVRDMIGYVRDASENKDDFTGMIRRMFEHMRFGVEGTFFNILKFGAQYYDHYISLGMGVDLWFIELYSNFNLHDDIFSEGKVKETPISADFMLRFYL